jgi:hypothetical protein
MQKNSSNIAILGGNDKLTNSFYKDCLKNYKSVVYINFSDKPLSSSKSLKYNLKIFELAKCFNILIDNKVKKVVLLGKLSRPNLSNFKLDGIIDKYISDLINAYKQGDGEILELVISIFQKNGFNCVSPSRASSNFDFHYLKENLIFNKKSSDKPDLKKSISILNSISQYDNAQSIVISNGYILAIEAVEGTDSMLNRVYKIKKKLNLLSKKEGILVKLPKRGQSLKIDLPVIGPKTVDLVKKANLNSIAICQKNTIIDDVNLTLLMIKKNKINLFFI